MPDQFFVYILAKDRNSTLLRRRDSGPVKRVWEHKNEVAEGFTKKYGVKKLVYYEAFENAEAAILREKRLKKWNRLWKIASLRR